MLVVVLVVVVAGVLKAEGGCGQIGAGCPAGEVGGVSGLGPSGARGAFGMTKGFRFFVDGACGGRVVVVVVVLVVVGVSLLPPPPKNRLKPPKKCPPDFLLVASGVASVVI